MRIRNAVGAHLGHSQHRNAYYLMLNTGLGAATGLVFWALFTRVLGLPASDVGVGYTAIAVGTLVGLLAKGGLDTALVRTIPGANRLESGRLLLFAVGIGSAVALLLSLVVPFASVLLDPLEATTPTASVLVAAIGVLLVVTWLQDAFFLGHGDAKQSFQRNVVFHTTRLLLPLLLAALAVTHIVALSWALALLASAVAGVLLARRVRGAPGAEVPRRRFLRTAGKNVSGSAAEFLPGLLLAPLVLALDGAESAAYFGIAWTAASLLFLASAAISRSTLTQLVRNGHEPPAHALHRALRLHVLLLAPAAVLGALFAPFWLLLFGSDYAQQGAAVLALLCLSLLFVAPYYVYLALLRARDHGLPLVAVPLVLLALLAVLAPTLEARWGLDGVAAAWVFANAPVGLWAAWRLARELSEVTPTHDAPDLRRRAHAE